MFKCPICNKEFGNLSEYARHISFEDDSAKAKAENEKLKRISELEKRIKESYDALKVLADEYNKLSGDRTCITSLSFRRMGQRSDFTNFSDMLRDIF